MMRVLALATGLGLAFLATASARAEDGLTVEHAAARMIVIAEARSSVSVTVQQGDPRLPQMTVRQIRRGVLVDGGLEHRIRGCRGGSTAAKAFGMASPLRDTRAVQVEGVGLIPINRLPVITARVPLSAKVAVGEAVWGSMSPSNGLDFVDTGCGDWGIGVVRGPLAVVLAGSGDVHAATAQTLNARVTGSGDLEMGDIGGPADGLVAGAGEIRLGAVRGGIVAQVAGSGDIHAASVDGAIKAKLASAGDVRIAAGRASNVAATVAGSGDFTFGGTAGAVSASVVGSGDITVAHVVGPVSKSVVGSGEINIDP